MTKKTSEKKKKPFIVRFLLSILIILLILILTVTGWFIYSALDKQNTAAVIPSDYTIYVRTDSAWDAVEPIIDLKATDMLLSDKSLSAVRPAILSFRQSHLRNNYFVKKALQRRLDITVYDNKTYLLVANMGFLSGITRLAPVILKFIDIKNLTYLQSGSDKLYMYQKGKQIFYIKIIKNLVIVTADENLFKLSTSFNNADNYTDTQLKALTENLKNPFKITCDGTRLLGMLASDSSNVYVEALSSAISMNEMSTVSFELTDTDINMKAYFPYEVNQNYTEHPLATLMKTESTVPSLLNKLPENVQYYTLINSFTLDQIRQAAFSVMPDSMNIESKWSTAQKASNAIFHTSIEDAFFSWTEDEISIFGLEGKAEPVIAIKISDEVQRQKIFDNLLSSIVLTSDNSLLVDSIRLPRIQVPNYIQSILEALGIVLPKPYYIVKDDYIYFSQSPENLVSVNNADQNNKRIGNNTNWKHVSAKMSPVSTVSLYYNLERSIPFFLKSQTTISNILKLYNIGRFDISSKNNSLTIQLSATVSESDYSIHVPGFPKAVENGTASQLCKSKAGKNPSVFYLAGNNSISTLDSAALTVTTKTFKDINWLIPASEKTIKSTNGELWACGKSGTIYLLTKELEIVKGFPIITDRISAKPVLYQDQLLFTTETNYLYYINSDGTEAYVETNFEGAIQASPSVLDNYFAIYEKGFLGGIHLYKDGIELNNGEPFIPDGIGFGSPCLFKKAHNLYIAFITQDGLLYILDDQLQTVTNFPMGLDGLFYVTLTYADGYLFALSSTGSLTRISLDGSTLEVEIPYFKAKTGAVTAVDYNNDSKQEIFVSGEGNTVYGFTSFMEMIEDLPVSGYNEPVFLDITGDKKNNMLILSIDNYLNAYKLN